MVPEFLKQYKLKGFYKTAELKKIITTDTIQIASFLQKMENEGCPVKCYRDQYGKKRYRLMDVVAKANVKGYRIISIEEALEATRIKQIKNTGKKNPEHLSKEEIQRHHIFHDQLSCQLTGRGILSHEEIINNGSFFSNKDVCGIYFLIEGNEVVYVGQSVNVFSRVSTHAKEKIFDGFKYIVCPKEKLDIMESIYIHFLNPKMNGEAGKNKSPHAPLSFEELLKNIEIKG